MTLSHHRDEPIDIHSELRPHDEVLDFLKSIQRSGRLKRYCNGSNLGGRWLFQIYTTEFIDELSDVINKSLDRSGRVGPVLEVMAGDGRLSEFLSHRVRREIITTDAKDGRYDIAYPKWVLHESAIQAIERHNPSFVLACWEPYLSMDSIMIAKSGVPFAWIGDPTMCGHPDLFQHGHERKNSPYMLSRHDSFLEDDFKTDIFLFNTSRID
ncbi:MAG: hypothetical protein ACTSV3_02640 [Candidatus Thorarchaeota archaeon]